MGDFQSNNTGDITFSAKKIVAPVDEQIRITQAELANLNRALAEIKETQSKILERVIDIETDRKLVGAATVAAIIISSLALVMSIVAVIAAFTIR